MIILSPYEIVFCVFAAEGCDPNQQLLKAKGKTAMHAAAAGGYVDIMACLRLVKKNRKLQFNSEITGK